MAAGVRSLSKVLVETRVVGMRSAVCIGASSPFQLSEIPAHGHIQKQPMSVAGYGVGATTWGPDSSAVPFGQELWGGFPLRCCAAFNYIKHRCVQFPFVSC